MKCDIKKIGGSDGIHDPDGFCEVHSCHTYSGGCGHTSKCHMAATGRTPHADVTTSVLSDITKRAAQDRKPALPLDSAERKRWPLYSGLMAYFPAALANVANHSFIGNEKHNPGQPMNHARNKSSDHEDCILRHLMDAAEHASGSATRIDELRGVAWRALALLQVECEIAGYRTAPAATFKDK